MASNPDSDHIRRSQSLYRIGLLTKLAAEAVNPTASAKGWEYFQGFDDATSSVEIDDLTSPAYQSLISAISTINPPYSTMVQIHTEPLPQEKVLIDWTESMPQTLWSQVQLSDPESVLFRGTAPSRATIQNESTAQEINEDDKLLLLYSSFANQVNVLEREVSESVRDSIRERLSYLLNASQEEYSTEQDLLKLSSVRGFYEFLVLSNVASVPSITLTWDGHIYAQWRESAKRSIGLRFVSSTRTRYALRNLPDSHSGNSSNGEIIRLIELIGLTALISPSAVDKVA